MTAEDLGRSRGETREGMDRAEAGGLPDRAEPGGPTTPMKRGNTESPRGGTPSLESQQTSDHRPSPSQNLPPLTNQSRNQ